ncbi:MAG: PocR ligand-binding domain-containing protein [Lentisphaeria bacterium]|nr:PocR ligand-binding domain-containing protein [Lentisphaeria bacterium]
MEHPFSLNLILKEQIQKLLDDFATVMRIHIVLFGSDGSVLRRGREEGCSDYCRLMQTHIFSPGHCSELDQQMESKCARTGQCESYLCHAGLCEAVMPIRAPGGHLLGYLMFGQFRTMETLPDFLRDRKVGRRLRSEAGKRYFELPYYSEEAVRNISGLLELLVDYIVRCELVTLGGDPVYTRLCDWIEKNFRSKVTASQAAKAIGRSVSGMTHALRAGGHKSFVALLTERRLAHAEMLLVENPDMTLSEAASLSGFQDPFYFSRAYRKSRGCTPGEYRVRHSKRQQERSTPHVRGVRT